MMASSLPEAETKTCRDCGAEKSLDDFYVRSDTGRRRNACKACDIDRLRDAPSAKGSAEYRAKYLRSKFGLTQADYDAMLAVQDGLCAICRRPGEQSYKGLHIDHDHESGRVRGLLCHRCNMALGLLGDSVTALAEAIAYLDRARSSERA